MKRIISVVLTVIMIAAVLTGCGGSDDTIQTIKVSNSSYTTKSELESAEQPDALTADNPIYTSILFIESRKGMEYTVKWYLDGALIKSETKATQKDMQDIISYELEADKAAKGSLKVEVVYNETILLTKELPIQ
jgi:hypothetical protein